MVKWLQTQREVVRSGAGPGGAWRCAGVALLTLVVFVGLNIAGCGGGGGGSSIISPTPAANGLIIVLRDANGRPVNGSVTLRGVTMNTVNARASFANVPAGTYQVTVVAGGIKTTTSIAVTSERGQTFVVSPSGSGTIIITGRVLLNGTDSSGNPTGCNGFGLGQGVSGRVIVRIRDLNTFGQPIVASYIKPDQSSLSASQQGVFALHISMPGTYRVEVRPASATGSAPFFGFSTSFVVIKGQTSVPSLDVCAAVCTSPDLTTCLGGTPPPPPGSTPTPIGNGTPGTPSATTIPGATVTPGGPATPTTNGTSSPASTPTSGGGSTPTPGGPTVTPGGVPTPTAAPTPTPTPTPTPAPTPTPGGPTATPVPTPTVVTATPTTTGASKRLNPHRHR